MTTPYRGYTEIPGAAVPDVPYRVNLALREIDADVADAVAELEAADTAAAGRLAVVEAAAGFGSGMKLQDDAVNGLLNGSTSTAATLTKQIETKGPAATVAALAVPASPTREAFDAHTLGHLADTFHGPLKAWGEALANRKTKPAIWVNLGSSTANGGTTKFTGQQWAQRVATYITGRSTVDNAALPRLEGVKARPSAAGVYAYTGAIGGTQSSNYVNADHLAAIKALQPDLITHMVGSNDYGSRITLAAYKANLRNWMDQLQAASPGTVHLMIHQQPRNDIGNPVAPWHKYGAAMAEVAAAYDNVSYLNASAYFPAEGQMPGHIMAEAVHMNEYGHKVLADAVAQAMGTPIYYARESISPKWVGQDNAAGVDSTVMSHGLAPAPYPREITLQANVYAYGKGAATALGAEMGIRAGYNDKDDTASLIQAGPLYQFRVGQGGANYARTYSASRTYHCDANRPFWVHFVAGGNLYVSGTNTYTDFKITAEPA